MSDDDIDIEFTPDDDNEEIVFTSERAAALEALRRLKEDGLQIDVEDEDDPDPGLSIADARKLLEALENLTLEEIRNDPGIRGRWSRIGGNYTLVGDTVDDLPPGYYDTALNNNQLFFVPMAPRYDKILRFPHAEVDTVIREIEAFWDREAAFRSFKLPYKRGILLYGPPGSGKTSALQLVARDVVTRGGVVLVFDSGLFLGAYRQLRHAQPDIRIVVLMEDLDAILERNESSILNLLDGAESMNRVIFVATTNYPEKLGPRIVNRPSRFDKRIFVGHPDDVGRKMYLESLIDGHEESMPDNFDLGLYVKDTRGMSLAHLKELFVATILIGTPYVEALSHLKTMNLTRPKSANDEDEFAEEKYGEGGFL